MVSACLQAVCGLLGPGQPQGLLDFLFYRYENSFHDFICLFICNKNIAVGAILLILYRISSFLPSMAAHVRRFHDFGCSGWWFLLLRIPALVMAILGVSWLGMVLGAKKVWIIWAFFNNYSFVLYFLIFLFILAEIGIHVLLALPSEPGPNRYGPPPTE